ncbi:unnamed protein product [Arctogadus glacialis]
MDQYQGSEGTMDQYLGQKVLWTSTRVRRYYGPVPGIRRLLWTSTRDSEGTMDQYLGQKVLWTSTRDQKVLLDQYLGQKVLWTSYQGIRRYYGPVPGIRRYYGPVPGSEGTMDQYQGSEGTMDQYQGSEGTMASTRGQKVLWTSTRVQKVLWTSTRVRRYYGPVPGVRRYYGPVPGSEGTMDQYLGQNGTMDQYQGSERLLWTSTWSEGTMDQYQGSEGTMDQYLGSGCGARGVVLHDRPRVGELAVTRPGRTAASRERLCGRGAPPGCSTASPRGHVLTVMDERTLARLGTHRLPLEGSACDARSSSRELETARHWACDTPVQGSEGCVWLPGRASPRRGARRHGQGCARMST